MTRRVSPADSCGSVRRHPRRAGRPIERRGRVVRAAALGALLAMACSPAPRSAPAPAPSAAQTPTATPAPRIVGYLASWGVRTRGTRIADLPGRELTHIIYAFARVTDDGRFALGDPCLDAGQCDDTATTAGHATEGGNFAELRRLKARYPHLEILVAAGGWSGSGRFSDVALTPESRRTFARSAVDVVVRANPGLFDGIDIDWEYPVRGGLPTNAVRPEDRQNCTLLLQELRRELDAQGERDGRTYRLTIATIAGPAVFSQLELEKVAATVDWLNVMTYDYHAGSRIAHFNAPLYTATGDPTPGFTVDSSVQHYLAGGVPASKIVVGVPFYGRVYGGVANVNDGLFQPVGGAVPDEWRTGTDYKSLVRRRPDTSGFHRFMHPEARVPWLYNAATGTWITYDDAESVAEKAAYVRSHRLGGVMAWELGGDDGTLIRTIHETLTGRR